MSIRLRSKWLSGAGALLLVFTLSGVAAGAALVNGTAPVEPVVVEPVVVEPVVVEPVPAVDTTATFEDTDGNGVDDDCQTPVAPQTAVVPDTEAAAKAQAAVDLDGDGTISTSEAAQSERTGGKNCNHGGYVSGVAKDQGDEVATAAEPVPAACVATVPPVPPVDSAPTVVAPTVVAPNAHGKAVSAVAQSDAVGGKNCNHGGAVSEVAKAKDHAAPGQATRNHAATGEAKSKAGKSHAADRAAKSHGKGHGRDH